VQYIEGLIVQPPQAERECINVPGDANIGKIIGTGGQRIRQMQDDFNVKIDIDRATSTVSVSSNGHAHARVKEAVQHVQGLVAEPRKTQQLVEIPDGVHPGQIIGKGGSEIQKFQDLHGVKASITDREGLQRSRDVDHRKKGCAVKLVGVKQATDEATDMLVDYFKRIEEQKAVLAIPIRLQGLFRKDNAHLFGTEVLAEVNAAEMERQVFSKINHRLEMDIDPSMQLGECTNHDLTTNLVIRGTGEAVRKAAQRVTSIIPLCVEKHVTVPVARVIQRTDLLHLQEAYFKLEIKHRVGIQLHGVQKLSSSSSSSSALHTVPTINATETVQLIISALPGKDLQPSVDESLSVARAQLRPLSSSRSRSVSQRFGRYARRGESSVHSHQPRYRVPSHGGNHSSRHQVRRREFRPGNRSSGAPVASSERADHCRRRRSPSPTRSRCGKRRCRSRSHSGERWKPSRKR